VAPDAASAASELRFLLDADLRPKIVAPARGLGLDILSVHDVGMADAPDDEVLRWAARQGRIVVTRNRDDFIEWTTMFFHRAAPHAGVLVVPTHLSIQRPERLAHALRRWVESMTGILSGQPLSPYFIGYLAE
jgi:predicted nuclease of predicted toxin-antitoxin system